MLRSRANEPAIFRRGGACHPAGAVFHNTSNLHAHIDELNRPTGQAFDDSYDPYDPELENLPRRQQHVPTPAQHRPLSSSGSSGPHSLRRTPRLADSYRPSPRRSPPARRQSRATHRPLAPSTDPEITFGPSGSTTPDSFQRLVESDQYWPQRSTHVSRKTHEAILFALEAVRAGKGLDAHPLSADRPEEEARMSDLLTGNAPVGATSSSRPHNGRSKIPAAAGPSSSGELRKPSDIMKAREERRQKKHAQEAELRQRDGTRMPERANVVGVGDYNQQRRQAQSTGAPNIPQAAPPPERISGGSVPTTNGATIRIGGPAPVQQPASNPQFPPGDLGHTTSINRNRTQAYEALTTKPVTAGPQPPLNNPPGGQNVPPPSRPPPVSQTSTRPAFPHAFERWETLSSHWEGLTGHWIRRLQSNTEELSTRPIDQAMARQITDLSAAGANLFHAVVELQRLRASSERKFQRWFFETQNEQKQAQEKMEELERQLQHERQKVKVVDTASLEAVQAEKKKAEELLREMRRELQISKEEARRAWEELGRREQEERERTIALRSGEPTLIGGVQVVPMAGTGLAGRGFSSVPRPQTRDGPLPGGPGPSTMGGQSSRQPRPPEEAFSQSQTTLDSPSQEQAAFSYQPGGTSPTETDPFTEPTRIEGSHPQWHESGSQIYGQQTRTQPQTSAAAIAAARNVVSTSQVPALTGGGASFQPHTASTTGYQQMPSMTTAQHGRAGIDRSDNRSYIPSVSGNGSEEEYHINPDGSYTRDDQGRRIPYHQPIGSTSEPRDDAEDDYTAEDERLYGEQYDQSPSAQPGQQIHIRAGNVTSSRPIYASPHRTPTNTAQPQSPPHSQPHSSSTISANSPPQGRGGAQPQTHQPEYDGSEYGRQPESEPSAAPSAATGWEAINVAPRHRHPTRLSDILEERSGRTSPSRTSYISGADLSQQGGVPPRR